jgi:hypothetical protein
MPGAKEELDRLAWLLREGKIQPDEKCKVILPRLEAKERIKNTEKRRRICMNTDEANYSEFSAMREAYTLILNQNPTLVVEAIIEAMKEFDVKGWFERQDHAGAQT